jgi:hypothetical protein
MIDFCRVDPDGENFIRTASAQLPHCHANWRSWILSGLLPTRTSNAAADLIDTAADVMTPTSLDRC